MAEGGDLKKSINDLEKEVTCGICQELFKEPKLLPCSHYFCKQCIFKLCLRCPAGNPISCPECRVESVISPNAVDDLKTAFHVNRLMDIHRSQLKSYEAEKVKMPAVVTTKSGVSSKCTEHGDFMKLYCYSCEGFICCDCALTNHKQHKYEYNTTAVPKRREELLQSKASFSNVEKEFQSALVKVKDRVAEIETSGQQVADFISSYFKQLHDVLNEREAIMLKQHKAAVSTNLSKLKAQETKLTEACDELSTVQDKIDAHFSSNSGDNILGSSRELMEFIESRKKTYEKETQAVRGKWAALQASRWNSNFKLAPTVSEHSDVAFKTSPVQFLSNFEAYFSFCHLKIDCGERFSIKNSTIFDSYLCVSPNKRSFFHICSVKKGNFSVVILPEGSKCQVSRIGCYTYLVEFTSPRYVGHYNVIILDDGKRVCTKYGYLRVQ